MSKYRGPRLRVIRRLFSRRVPHEFDRFTGASKMARVCSTRKLSRPGQHGAKKTKKPTQFAIRLKEKQKLRTYYAISEKQLVRYVKEARKVKEPTGEVLIRLLENRPDAIIYRQGLASSVLEARQLLGHGHLTNAKEIIPKHVKHVGERPCVATTTGRFTININPRLVVEYYSNRL